MSPTVPGPFSRAGMAAFCAAVALMAGAASGIGVFARGGSTETVVSVRGERYLMRTDGVYRFNADRLVAEGVGWDVFTLFAAVPALLAAVPFVARGSFRGRLFALGMLGYFSYQYLMYAVTWAFGPLFPLFVAIYALGIAGIAWAVSSIGLAGIEARFSERFPRRGMAAVSLLMALLLTAMWTGRIVAGLSGDLSAAMLLGQTTLVVQALDLGIVVPLATVTGVALLARWRVSYLLAPVVAVKAVAMGGAILAMLLSAWLVEGRPEGGSLAVFAAATVLFAGLALRIYRSAYS